MCKIQNGAVNILFRPFFKICVIHKKPLRAVLILTIEIIVSVVRSGNSEEWLIREFEKRNIKSVRDVFYLELSEDGINFQKK